MYWVIAVVYRIDAIQCKASERTISEAAGAAEEPLDAREDLGEEIADRGADLRAHHGRRRTAVDARLRHATDDRCPRQLPHSIVSRTAKVELNRDGGAVHEEIGAAGLDELGAADVEPGVEALALVGLPAQRVGRRVDDAELRQERGHAQLLGQLERADLRALAPLDLDERLRERVEEEGRGDRAAELELDDGGQVLGEAVEDEGRIEGAGTSVGSQD